MTPQSRLDRLLPADGYHRRALAMLAALSVVAGTAGTALSLGLTNLEDQVIGLWQGQTSGPDIRITGHDASVQSPDQVDVTVDLYNTDTNNAHFANVTVQLLDGSGNILAEDTKATNKMDPDGTLAIDYSFTKSNLAEDWSETFAVVDQSD